MYYGHKYKSTHGGAQEPPPRLWISNCHWAAAEIAAKEGETPLVVVLTSQDPHALALIKQGRAEVPSAEEHTTQEDFGKITDPKHQRELGGGYANPGRKRREQRALGHDTRG